MDPSLLNEGPIGRGDCRRTRLPGSSTGCSRSRGIRAQDRVETLLRIAWTECSRSSGIGAQDPVDYAAVVARGPVTSRSLMGSSNTQALDAKAVPRHLAIPHGEIELGRHDRQDHVGVLAIPHGEFETAPVQAARLTKSFSRSLMGSSNSRAASTWADSRASRSLMGSSNGEFERRACWCRRSCRRSRDPSWGVRTDVLKRQRVQRRELAIPHGEFERPRARRRKLQVLKLAIPHGEFKLALGTANKRLCRSSRDPSWGVRTRAVLAKLAEGA